MTENKEMSAIQAQVFDVQNAVSRGNQVALLGNIAISLFRIAEAQEKIVALSTIDLEETIEAAIEDRAQQKAAELDEARSSRTYIGKKKD